MMNFETLKVNPVESAPHLDKTNEKELSPEEITIADKQETQSILKKIASNPGVRSLVLSSLLALSLAGPVKGETQSNKKSDLKNKTEQIDKTKTFENNYLIQGDLKRWIHWIKTKEFINSDQDMKINDIKDVSDEEMKIVYNYLEGKIDVWNLSALTEFGGKLELAVEELGTKKNLKEQTIKPTEVTSSDMSEFWNPEVAHSGHNNKLGQDALNLAIEINQILK